MIKKSNKKTQLNIGTMTNIGDRLIFGKMCQEITIGFGCFIGDDVYIDVPNLIIGDYTTIHKNTTIHGYQNCHIGHNCWIGQNTIIDSIGGVFIMNNVGIGAYSQLWSHIKFGDVLAGCRWNKSKGLIIYDDAWFVGHSIVCPIEAKKKSMLLVGSVATHDMKENHVYGGVPAIDMTDKVGTQFKNESPEKRRNNFIKHYRDFLKINRLTDKQYQAILTDDLTGMGSTPKLTYFDIGKRTYKPSRSENEYKFMKYLLYDKAKFVPYE